MLVFPSFLSRSIPDVCKALWKMKRSLKLIIEILLVISLSKLVNYGINQLFSDRYLNCSPSIPVAVRRGEGGGGRGKIEVCEITLLFPLNGNVTLDRACSLWSSILQRVYNFTSYCLKQGIFLGLVQD